MRKYIHGNLLISAPTRKAGVFHLQVINRESIGEECAAVGWLGFLQNNVNCKEIK